MNKADERVGLSMVLRRTEFDRLTSICKRRGQSMTDFLRGAIKAHRQVPNINTRPLSGACLQKHLDRLEREKRTRRRRKVGKK